MGFKMASFLKFDMKFGILVPLLGSCKSHMTVTRFHVLLNNNVVTVSNPPQRFSGESSAATFTALN